MSAKHQTPDWVTRGKTIRQLIQELRTFEDQDLEVRISLDTANAPHPISIVQKQGGYCVLANEEAHYAAPTKTTPVKQRRARIAPPSVQR